MDSNFLTDVDIDYLSSELKKIIDDLFEDSAFDCKKLYFKNKKYVCNDIYYCTEDVLKCLGYLNKDVINRKLGMLSKDEKYTIYDLYEKYIEDINNFDYNQDLNNELIKSLNRYEMEQIYISETTLFELINSSSQDKAQPFQKFINRQLLPLLKLHYELIIYEQKNKIKELNAKIELLHSL